MMNGSDWILSNLGYKGDECLIWPFGRVSRGYGVIRIDGRTEYAHVVMCTLKNGKRNGSKRCARHICGNGHLGCVNPQHLVWGTNSENQIDRAEHGTDMRGEKHHNVKLTSNDVLNIIQDDRLQSEIAADYGVTRHNVGLIKRGKRWSWLTGITQA